MDWDDLRFLLAIGRAGTVPGAAKALGVAHTTVYRRLDAVEGQYGATLFDRSGGSCAPTRAGRDLVALAEDVEQRLVAFERVLDGEDQRLDGDVTVATMEPLAVGLGEHLLALRRLHPAIRVHLQVTDAFVDLARRDADLALRATRAPSEDLVGQKIADLGFAVYAAASWLRGRSTDLAQADWVCFDPSRADTPQGRWEQAEVPGDRVVFRTNSRAVFREVVAAGGGVGVLPCGLATGLVPLTEPIEALRLPLWLLAHADLARTPRIRVVRSFLAQALERDRPRFEGAGVRPR